MILFDPLILLALFDPVGLALVFCAEEIHASIGVLMREIIKDRCLDIIYFLTFTYVSLNACQWSVEGRVDHGNGIHSSL